MPRNGSGAYSQPVSNFVSGTTIVAADMNTWLGDLGSEIANSLAKDGQTSPTANLPMGGFRHTNVSNATARDQYYTLAQAMNDAATWRGTAGGTGDALTITTSPTTTAYAQGERHTFIMPGTNTGAVTLNVNGIGAVAVVGLGGSALTAGSLVSGQIVHVVYVAPGFRVVSHGMITGGSVGGNLTLRGATPTLTLYSNTDSAGVLTFQRDATKRWDVQTIDAETGSNAGRDLAFIAYDDAGVSLGRALTIYRATRQIAINPNGTAAAPALSFFNDPDTGVYQSAVNTIDFSTGGTLRFTLTNSTATLTTPLVLPASDPTTANQASRKAYVDAQDATRLPLAGGTMTGALLAAAGTVSAPGIGISGDTNTGIYAPAADQLAVTTGGAQRLLIANAQATLTTPLVLPASDPTADDQAARKAYVDTQVATKATTPTATVGAVGRWVVLSSGTLPTGGTFAYFVAGVTGGAIVNHQAGVAAGGTVVLSGATSYIGFAWRIA